MIKRTLTQEKPLKWRPIRNDKELLDQLYYDCICADLSGDAEVEIAIGRVGYDKETGTFSCCNDDIICLEVTHFILFEDLFKCEVEEENGR